MPVQYIILACRNKIRQIMKDESGAEIMEYAIVIAIVAALIAVVSGIGAAVQSKTEDAANIINNM